MSRFSRRAQVREAARMAGILAECLAVVAAVAVIAITARFGGDSATLVRQAAGMSHLTVEAR